MCRKYGLTVFFMLLLLIGVPTIALTSQSQISVTSARVATHDDLTRLVLDITSSVTFTISSSDTHNYIFVDLPELSWNIPVNSSNLTTGLLTHLTYEKVKPGLGRLRIETFSPATILKSFIIPPTSGNGYRLVFDIKRREKSLNFNVPTVTDNEPKKAFLPIPPQKHNEEPTNRQPQARTNQKPIVVIDPGHGGVDPGATSVSGAYEKNIVLALARELKKILDDDGKVKCILTRERDIFIPLRERVTIARTKNANLFVSLHADIVADPNIRGLSVYTLSQNASDAEAQALADKENKSDIVAGINLSGESQEVANILIDLIQRESMNNSAIFARQLIASVSRETNELLENTHRFAGFAVLKAPDIPSVLVETGYLSNDHDEQMLRDPKYRIKLTTALAKAIEQYFKMPPKGQHS